MNNPLPSQNIGQYRTNEYLDVILKCQFCNSILLGCGNQRHIIHSTMNNWLCIKCPNPVIYNARSDDYSIMVEHNDYFYEIAYMNIAKVYLIYQIRTNLHLQTEVGSENYNSYHELIKQFSSERNITPTNAKDKLLTILTFS